MLKTLASIIFGQIPTISELLDFAERQIWCGFPPICRIFSNLLVFLRHTILMVSTQILTMGNMAYEAAAKEMIQYRLNGEIRQYVTVNGVNFLVPINEKTRTIRTVFPSSEFHGRGRSRYRTKGKSNNQ